MLALVSLLLAPAAAQSLVISGSCPGTMDLDVRGLTQSGSYAVISSNGTGGAIVPSGPCTGTPTGLSTAGIALRAVRTADALGEGTWSPGVPPAGCGSSVQVLDLASCLLTNVSTLTGPPSSCEEARLRGAPSTGQVTLKVDGGPTLEAWCDQDTEGGGWLDLVATMHLPGNDPDGVLDRFFVTNGVNGTQITAGIGLETSTGAPGFYIDNDAYGPDSNQGFHLMTSGFGFTDARVSYRMQGSDHTDTGPLTSRCAMSGWWIPLNGPGFDGGNSTNLSPCPAGFTCEQGSNEWLRDEPIQASYSMDGLPGTTLLTWSGSITNAVSENCARDPEIPTDHPTTFFTQALLR